MDLDWLEHLQGVADDADTLFTRRFGEEPEEYDCLPFNLHACAVDSPQKIQQFKVYLRQKDARYTAEDFSGGDKWADGVHGIKKQGVL